MTILVTSCAVLVSGLVLVVSLSLGSAASDRARAQTAADAAALAAVAESVPGGTGAPARAARRFARLNGASLESCLCVPGETAAQVRVAFGEASAIARAVFDPERLMPAAVPRRGLHPALDGAVRRLLALAGGRIFVVSGLRTIEEQGALWRDALARYGDAESADDWVARPGTSKHELGLAVDLGGDLELARRLVHRFELPLVRPLPREPWHFELDLL